ncbi:MAG: response regulator, partial [Deltaproteobacteria bacterium]|nr:response regulator [Deltaproteobacteria bacterium]
MAENGEEALFIAGEYLPHLIMMDIAMPVMDGLEATRALKSNPKTKDIPVLVLSASSNVEQKAKIMESGMFAAFLDKPLNVSQLLKELSNYLAHSRTNMAGSAAGPVHEQSSFTFDVNELPEETLTRLPDLVKILREDIIPGLDAFKGALQMGEIEEFADKIKQLGEDFGIPRLSHCAAHLEQFAEDFDIDGIHKTLEDFKTMADNLVSHSEDL